MSQSLPTGTYILTNSSTGLPIKPQYRPANSNIICDKNDNSDNFKWMLQYIALDFYTIQNVGDSLYASCSNNVVPPEDVLVECGSHYFTIDPVPGLADTYTIATIDSGVYLGLRESVSGARLVVGASGTGQLYQWVITQIS